MRSQLAFIKVIRVVFVFTVILCLVIGGVLWQKRPISWSQERQITNGSGDSRLVDLSADQGGNILHLAWEDNRDGTAEVYYKRSLDDGVTWGPDIKLSHLTPETADPEPRVATSGAAVFIVYSNRTSTGEHLFYLVSEDRGSDFSQTMELTHDSGDQTNAAVASVGSMLHVIWQEQLDNGEEHIFYARSSDAGQTWQHDIALTNGTAQDQYPAIDAVGDRVFVAWSRSYEGAEAIYARVSLDAGLTWQPEVQVSAYDIGIFPQFPAMGSNGTAVHLVWGSTGGIQYSRSSDFGATWSTPINLTNATRQYVAPRIAVANLQVQVVMAGILGATSDVYYASSSDGGESWTASFSVTAHSSSALSLAPVVWSSGAVTFIAWEDNRNGRLAIFFLSKPDFAVLRSFEREVFIPIGITLVAASALYLGFEVKLSRAVRRRRGRKRKARRK